MQTRLMSRPRIASVPLGDQSQRRAITEHLVALRLRSLLVVYAVVAVGGCSDEEVVNVPEVASVEVFPTRQVFAVGRTAMFTAIRRDSLGQQFGGPDVSWTSSNENVAAVDFILSSGVVDVTGLIPGSATIFAMSEGQSTSAEAVITRQQETFFVEQDFLRVSGAVALVTYPAPRPKSTAVYAEGGITLRHVRAANNEIADFTPTLSGNEFAVYEAIDVDVEFAAPVRSVGFWMQVLFQPPSCPWRALFQLVFQSSAGIAFGWQIAPTNDDARFFGFILDEAIDRIEIRELLSPERRAEELTCGNVLIGRIFAGGSPPP